MSKTHGLFIPEASYLVDLEGLIKYLNQKVNEEFQCLYCGRLKWSEDGIKTHMRDVSHCKIAYETEDQQLEIGEDLFIRIAPGGRKFLLFCLDGEPERGAAEAIAAALGLKEPQYGWHQGATLRSLTVIEPGADHLPESGPAEPEDGTL